VSLPAVTARLYASDEVQYFSYLRSLYFDHDVSFENEYRYFHDRGIAASPGFHETFLVNRTGTGRRVNYGTIGSALLWMPFYAVADVWMRATGTADADGFSAPYVRAVACGSAFYAFVAVLLSLRAARIVLGPAGSMVSALAVWFGTPLLFYMYVAPPFAHATSAFAVALFVSVWLHVRRTWTTRGTFALGLCAGLLGLVREQDIFIALGPAVDFALARVDVRSPGLQAAGRWLPAAAAGVAGTILALTPQLLAYQALNGHFGPASHVSRKMYWHAPYATRVVASPEHGLIFWTPLVLLSLAGIIMMIARRADLRRVATVLMIMVVSQVYVAGSVGSWSVAGAFGQRRFVGLTIVFVMGLAALWQMTNRRVLGVVVALCVWWNVALMAQFATRMMDRQRLELGRNAYNAFVTLPLEFPALASRYLTNRESFYEQRQGGPR
jgi:hypothetical protein